MKITVARVAEPCCASHSSYLTSEVFCGRSDKKFVAEPELIGRHCALPAGHKGFHLAQRDNETLAETMRRCSK